MFKNRQEAGQKLALELKKIIKGENFVVVALLRGGIVLGKIVADYFKVPLKPLSVKKIGAPLNSELAIGAVTFNKTYYFDNKLIKHLHIDKNYMENLFEAKWKEAKTLQDKFPTSPRLRRAGNSSLKNKKVVIIDDGAATGTTAICASIYAKKEKAKEVILAVPVIAKDSVKTIKPYFDRIVSLKIADNLVSISQFYREFPQVEDKEVINILKLIES